MKTYIQDVEDALQALALRSIELVDRASIRSIVMSMYDTYDGMQPSAERLILKTYIERLEEAIK